MFRGLRAWGCFGGFGKVPASVFGAKDSFLRVLYLSSIHQPADDQTSAPLSPPLTGHPRKEDGEDAATARRAGETSRSELEGSVRRPLLSRKDPWRCTCF